MEILKDSSLLKFHLKLVFLFEQLNFNLVIFVEKPSNFSKANISISPVTALIGNLKQELYLEMKTEEKLRWFKVLRNFIQANFDCF